MKGDGARIVTIESGRAAISVNGRSAAIISASGNQLTISIDDEQLRAAVRRFGLSIRVINLLGKASEALYKMGAAVEVRDSRGTLIQLGVGAYSTTVKFKANLARLLLLMLG
ncbi:hypothetical protein GCM10007981_03690 [Thermocladium modestius]|uniref:Uncharacterized protein n=1 Tax=Thermocladium modestius TaxID=62609 RepID=A0A830GU47_9CREN|nr:hypothetical protein [Thermocladium modestius]GGP19550.1 hypothetical protein GCM10007981_03690 [Thermocladium modestius]